jgi:transposase
MASKTANRFSPEVRARAVRLVFAHEKDHRSRWASVTSIAAKIGCTAQSLNDWVKKAQVDSGARAAARAGDAIRSEKVDATSARPTSSGGRRLNRELQGPRPATALRVGSCTENALIVGMTTIGFQWSEALTYISRRRATATATVLTGEAPNLPCIRALGLSPITTGPRRPNPSR